CGSMARFFRQHRFASSRDSIPATQLRRKATRCSDTSTLCRIPQPSSIVIDAGLGATVMRSVRHILFFLLSLSTASFAADVQIEGSSDGYRLMRNGKPYFIKGICGDQRLDLLAQIGGNTFRTTAGDQLTYDLD